METMRCRASERKGELNTEFYKEKMKQVNNHRRRARAFRAFTVKAHFVVQSDSVVHWRQKNREKKAKKKKENR